MTVNNALVSIDNVDLGFIRMVKYVELGEATERTLDTYTSRELTDDLNRNVSAVYRIGEYWYIVYKA